MLTFVGIRLDVSKVMNSIFEELAFAENPLYESIIDDLLAKKYSVVESFFTAEEVLILRQSLIEKHALDAFKKAAIGNRVRKP